MDSKQREQVKKDLHQMDNVQQMFDYLSKHYDLTDKLGSITKGTFIMGIDKAMVMVNPKKK